MSLDPKLIIMKSGFGNFDLQNSTVSEKLYHFMPLVPVQHISTKSFSNSKYPILQLIALDLLQYIIEDPTIHTSYFL